MRTTDHEGISNRWVPTYFTFRAPSEHTFAGKHMDLELQFVHRSPQITSYDDVKDTDKTRLDNNIMILSVFFDREAGGEETNEIIEDLQFNRASQGTWELPNLDIPKMMKELWLQEDQDFLQYSGSLPFPPCTEGVEWNVLAKVQSLSQSQLSSFTSSVPSAEQKAEEAEGWPRGNNRSTQEINERRVFYKGPYSSAITLTASALALVTLLSF